MAYESREINEQKSYVSVRAHNSKMHRTANLLAGFIGLRDVVGSILEIHATPT